jgi:hypothetical protein
VESDYHVYVGIDWASEAHEACVLDHERRAASGRFAADLAQSLLRRCYRADSQIAQTTSPTVTNASRNARRFSGAIDGAVCRSINSIGLSFALEPKSLLSQATSRQGYSKFAGVSDRIASAGSQPSLRAIWGPSAAGALRAADPLPSTWECACFATHALLLYRPLISQLNSRLPERSSLDSTWQRDYQQGHLRKRMSETLC